MQHPYLEGALKERFDRWLDSALSRAYRTLKFSEIRKSVQSLGNLYGELSGSDELAVRAIDGQGKRAALATFFAAKHFLTTHHATVMLDVVEDVEARRILDVGCGTGAVGAAVALTFDTTQPPAVVGFDRSGWALDEARKTWIDLGVSGRGQRIDLPKGLPQSLPGDLICAGWLGSELSPQRAKSLISTLDKMTRGGASLLIIEPQSSRFRPHWDAWSRQLKPLGVRDEMIRVSVKRPLFIQDMDRAARLDNQVLAARVLYVANG